MSDLAINIQREVMTDALVAEAMPLALANNEEISPWPGMPLEIDGKVYLAAEQAGWLRCYTVRTDAGQLVGYAAFMVHGHPHHANVLHALQSVIYLAPAWRLGRAALELVKFSDEQLAAEGVQVVYRDVSVKRDWGRLLERMGYVRVETTWGRRLNSGT